MVNVTGTRSKTRPSPFFRGVPFLKIQRGNQKPKIKGQTIQCLDSCEKNLSLFQFDFNTWKSSLYFLSKTGRIKQLFRAKIQAEINKGEG